MLRGVEKDQKKISDVSVVEPGDRSADDYSATEKAKSMKRKRTIEMVIHLFYYSRVLTLNATSIMDSCIGRKHESGKKHNKLPKV
jgi:hypothetical protein